MKLSIRCPATSCKGHLHAIDAGLAATEIADRKCRRCGATWRIVVTPIRAVMGGAGFAHRLDWLCLAGARGGQLKGSLRSAAKAPVGTCGDRTQISTCRLETGHGGVHIGPDPRDPDGSSLWWEQT
jgi:hypothetical protein